MSVAVSVVAYILWGNKKLAVIQTVEEKLISLSEKKNGNTDIDKVIAKKVALLDYHVLPDLKNRKLVIREEIAAPSGEVIRKTNYHVKLIKETGEAKEINGGVTIYPEMTFECTSVDSK
jgi:hypothetical protein